MLKGFGRLLCCFRLFGEGAPASSGIFFPRRTFDPTHLADPISSAAEVSSMTPVINVEMIIIIFTINTSGGLLFAGPHIRRRIENVSDASLDGSLADAINLTRHCSTAVNVRIGAIGVKPNDVVSYSRWFRFPRRVFTVVSCRQHVLRVDRPPSALHLFTLRSILCRRNA